MPAINALLPYFGSARLVAPQIGRALDGCTWVGVPFLGGGPELAHMTARTIVANDLHRGVVNLARVAADPNLGAILRRDLKALPFHADVLAGAQARCRGHHAAFDGGPWPDFDGKPWLDYDFARDYFVCCWMGRSGQAGTPKEFSGGLPVRWDANGGDSAVRYRSAVASLRDWRRVLARVNFTCMDAFDFLAKCHDRPGHGIYCDPPWPDDGDEYTHRFDEAHHRRLAATLSAYREARVVCRFGDHSLVRELYPESAWRWATLDGRTSANKAKAEVLLTLNGAPA
jgi:DNA adenine methylase